MAETDPVLIIAEAGVNHNGDIDMAQRIIVEAAAAGADYVKFQTFSAETLVTKTAPKADYQKQATSWSETQYEMIKKLELSKADHEKLIATCIEAGVGFLSTAFDIASFDMLMVLSEEWLVKVPSGEITNLPLLRRMGQANRPVILSTGMAEIEEIEAAIDVMEEAGTQRHKFTILHCTTAYPTPPSDVNLRAMVTLGNHFGLQVGYSDHTQGIEVPIAAVALGARVIEKHVTLDRNLPGPDHKASLEMDEFEAMVKSIRTIEMALGDGLKRRMPSEVDNLSVARRSIVARCLIKVGEVFTTDNLTTMRPGTGLSPMVWDNIIGQTAKRDYQKNEQISDD
ncbi:MAG: N-acetylneuraminate synthase [Alphaproteobacteria bacterium]|nr:N-acetylneuraminate synthase [Alphaproteobacteria bacterium]